MSQSGKLETVAPSLRTAHGAADATQNMAAANVAGVVGRNAASANNAGPIELQITSDRPTPIEEPGAIKIAMDRTAVTSAAAFSIQNLLALLPGWSVSLVGHGAALALLAAIATAPVYDGSALHLDGLIVDSTELSQVEDIQNDIDLTEAELLNIDVSALNSEAGDIVAEIVRDDGFEVSLLEGMADGIGMEAMANTGLTPVPTVDKGGVQGKTEGSSTQFFGTKASGSRFVFIIDGSGSMTQGFRWLQAIRELEKSIGKLNENQRALVLVYNFHTYPMFGIEPEDVELVPVTDEFKKALNDWLAGLTPQGGTRPAHALEYSLSLEPDAIFLLSDGLLADQSVRILARKNKARKMADGVERKIPIHAVSLGPDEDGAEVMKIIADNNEGQFNWVR